MRKLKLWWHKYQIWIISGTILLLGSISIYWFILRPVPDEQFVPETVPTPTPVVINSTGLDLKIAQGFAIAIYAKDLLGVMTLRQDPYGHLLVTIPNTGRIYGFYENKPRLVQENLHNPFGMLFINSRLYVAEKDQISNFNYNPDNLLATDKRKTESRQLKQIVIDQPGIYKATQPETNKIEVRKTHFAYIPNKKATHDILSISGSKIVRQQFDENSKPIGKEDDFLVGLASPVYILVHSDGGIYIADSKAGIIYKVIRYE